MDEDGVENPATFQTQQHNIFVSVVILLGQALEGSAIPSSPFTTSKKIAIRATTDFMMP